MKLDGVLFFLLCGRREEERGCLSKQRRWNRKLSKIKKSWRTDDDLKLRKSNNPTAEETRKADTQTAENGITGSLEAEERDGAVGCERGCWHAVRAAGRGEQAARGRYLATKGHQR